MKRVLLVAAVLMLVASACTAATKESPPSTPQAAPKSTTKFTTVPEGCELLDRETLAKYAPTTTCSLTLQDNRQTQNGDGEPILERWPRYKPANIAGKGKFHAVIEVGLKLNLDTYAENQTRAAQGTSGPGSSQRPVAGIGDKAHLYYRAGTEAATNLSMTTGVLVSSWGNASLMVHYWHYQAATTDNGAGLSEQKMAKALIAVARDVYDDLS
ncbi:hypothetical protein [Nonomuraea typhae]|uniref:hypothetical protein n=1 Tax=Nonomuraea typhae TaxID=2603600 RepID=UPI0012FC70FD|nr:hypothetical protein [Nonomuraea typhae]